MKQRLTNWLLKTVVRVVVPSDVIWEKNGVLYLGKEVITPTELQNLQQEAKVLESMRLWSVLNETTKQKAYERGWTTATALDHLNAGKIQYHTLDTQNSIVNIIKGKKLA